MAGARGQSLVSLGQTADSSLHLPSFFILALFVMLCCSKNLMRPFQVVDSDQGVHGLVETQRPDELACPSPNLEADSKQQWGLGGLCLFLRPPEPQTGVPKVA